MELRLAGKKALVTGVAGERGIGRAIALALAEEDCVLTCVDVNGKGAEETTQQIIASGKKAVALQCDQSSYESVRKTVAEAGERMGGIDILVNNAAWMDNVNLIRNMSVESWEKELSINLSGLFYFIKETLPIMTRGQWGRIINISSLLGLTGVGGRPGYCAAKSGLIGLTKTAAIEGARFNITANVLFCGMVDTGSARATVPEQHWDLIVRRNALQRAATPAEIADVVTFYASERSAFITGSEVLVDGGQTLLVL